MLLWVERIHGSIIGDSGGVVTPVGGSTSACHASHMSTGNMGTRPYLSAPDAAGDNADNLRIEVDDNGHTGFGGGGKILIGNVNVDITPVGDTPQVANVNTMEDTQSDPIVLDRHAADGPEVTHFRISNITNGSLFHNDGITPINDGDFILVAAGQLGLRFQPAPDSNATGNFGVESSEDGTTIAAQSGVATSTINITSVNDAPILDNTGDMALTDVIKDSLNPSGNSVASIISSAGGNRITDADHGAVEGLAIIGVDETHGTWEYSTDSGASWHSFVVNGVASVSTDDTSAVLLDDTALIRFVPNPSYVGPAGDITFRA